MSIYRNTLHPRQLQLDLLDHYSTVKVKDIGFFGYASLFKAISKKFCNKQQINFTTST